MSLVGDIISIAFDVGKFLAEAISSGDVKTWRAIADILPDPLKSRIERVGQDTLTQQAVEDVLRKDSD
jgi:hypothetical protein